ncbi:MAG TPA: carbamoyltransferase C-terminal domain-containing protein [Xanthobacteraceae bacterium]|jgi:carbamoyltransferase
MRIGPKNPRLGKAVFRLALPWIDRFYEGRQIFRATSAFAKERFAALRAKFAAGEPLYIGGICASGVHNTGVALVEVTRDGGPNLICNNEEERFSGERHTMRFPHLSIDSLVDLMRRRGTGPEGIDVWMSAWDNAAHGAAMLRVLVEEAPISLWSLPAHQIPTINLRELSTGTRAARILGRRLGSDKPVPLIATPHHDNHAWFSFCVSPFAHSDRPVMIAVLDGAGDVGAISLYVVEQGRMRQIRSNDSLFDSLGVFYTIISSTQGGWTWLSCEGRYMGAAAWGNNDRKTNPWYRALKEILSFAPEGQIYINRDLANWARSFAQPYTRELIRILGKPISFEDMWNPDAVLRVEDIKHKENTQERLDKAAATQMVLEDALIHVIDHLIRRTGSDQLALTGGVALNAVGSMRILEYFDAAYYQREFGRRTRLHLWVPPTPNDAGVAMGAAYMGAYLSGAGPGTPLQHAFYCGRGPSEAEIRAAVDGAADIGFAPIGEIATAAGREAVADLMAFMTAQDGVIALFQGPAETGPRALGHRSILANPCNPATREVLNSRVKYREAIRPLAPMMTREAAQLWFDLSDGACDDDYNAYNYMVLTAPAKPQARARIPAVVHADGTGRLQIVREAADPLVYTYLKALGRRIGVEVAVNTSFNVAGPIAQTPVQAVATLRRSKGMDAVLMVAEEGPVFAIWPAQPHAEENAPRFADWFARWQADG